MIISDSNLNTLYTGFKTAFKNGTGQAMAQWPKVAMKVSSSTASEEYGYLGKFPGMREWVGDRSIDGLEMHDYTIKNKKYESTIAVERDKIEDDNWGAYGPLFTELGRAAAAHPDELVWSLLKNGFSTACYDGQYFFDTDHPVIQEGGSYTTVSNDGGGSGTPWFLFDATRSIKPIIFQERRMYELRRRDGMTDPGVFERDEFTYGVDGRCNVGFGFWQFAYGSKHTLNATSYETARTSLMGMKGDYGRPLGLRPNLLVVPPALEKEALEIINSERLSNGSTNVYKNTATLEVVPWLA